MNALARPVHRGRLRVHQLDSGILASWALRAGVLLTAILVLGFNPYDKPVAHIWMGIAVLVLSLWPMDQWLRAGSARKIPIFELHLVFFALCIGLAAFVELPRAQAIHLRVDEQSYTVGLLAALVCILCEYVGYFLGRRTHGTMLARAVPRFPWKSERIAIAYVYPVALVLSLLVRHFHVAALGQIIPPIRLFAFVWALCAAWSGDTSKPFARITLLCILPVEVFIFGNFLFSGFLFGLLTYGELIIVCYAVCRGRVLLWIALLGLGMFFAIQPIKAQMRNAVWVNGSSTTLSERADIVSSAAAANIGDLVDDGSLKGELMQSYARLNHLADSSAVIQATSADNMYRHGSTYLPMLTKWIPRFLWPGKPEDNIGNDWARHYGFLDADDYTTSFNLPWLPEMFMNFGWAGIVVISLAVGWAMGYLKRAIIDRVNYPVEIAFAYTIAAPFFFPESNLSLSLGGIVTAWISITFLLILIRMVQRIGLQPARTPST